MHFHISLPNTAVVPVIDFRRSNRNYSRVLSSYFANFRTVYTCSKNQDCILLNHTEIVRPNLNGSI
jgi:hypothetical protein